MTAPRQLAFQLAEAAKEAETAKRTLRVAVMMRATIGDGASVSASNVVEVMRASARRGPGPSAIGRQGPTEGVSLCRDRRPRLSRIFATAHFALNFMRAGTQRRCAMWRMSNFEALIFIAVVLAMVAAWLLVPA